MLFQICNLEVKGNGSQLTTAERLGKVGNTWNVTFPNGQKMSAQISENKNGIVTLDVSFNRENYKLKMKVTDNSVSNIFYGDVNEAKEYTLIEKDAKVGDRYTYKVNDYMSVEREVIEVGTSYHINCLGKEIPTVGIAEYMPYRFYPQIAGYSVSIVWWYISWEYGVVCIGITTSDGDYFEIEFGQISVG